MAFVLDFDGAQQRQTEGVWAEFGGAKFLIASASNLRFQRVLSRLQAPHRRKIDSGVMDPGESRRIMAKSLSEAILLDWKNVTDGQKAQVLFSKEVAEQALISLDDLREFVIDFSTNLMNFKSEFVEELGN